MWVPNTPWQTMFPDGDHPARHGERLQRWMTLQLLAVSLPTRNAGVHAIILGIPGFFFDPPLTGMKGEGQNRVPTRSGAGFVQPGRAGGPAVKPHRSRPPRGDSTPRNGLD